MRYFLAAVGVWIMAGMFYQMGHPTAKALEHPTEYLIVHLVFLLIGSWLAYLGLRKKSK
jgi:hypothetical protein